MYCNCISENSNWNGFINCVYKPLPRLILCGSLKYSLACIHRPGPVWCSEVYNEDWRTKLSIWPGTVQCIVFLRRVIVKKGPRCPELVFLLCVCVCVCVCVWEGEGEIGGLRIPEPPPNGFPLADNLWRERNARWHRLLFPRSGNREPSLKRGISGSVAFFSIQKFLCSSYFNVMNLVVIFIKV